MLNANWGMDALGHTCVMERRGDLLVPCCKSIDDVIYKMKWALVTLIFWYLPTIPCLTRWLTVYANHGWYVLGALVHNLLPRAYIEAFSCIKADAALAVEEERDDDWTAEQLTAF